VGWVMKKFVYVIIFDTKHNDFEIEFATPYPSSYMYGALKTDRNGIEMLSPDYLIKITVVHGEDEAAAVEYARILLDNYIKF
jgi:hypothetical protein